MPSGRSRSCSAYFRRSYRVIGRGPALRATPLLARPQFDRPPRNRPRPNCKVRGGARLGADLPEHAGEIAVLVGYLPPVPQIAAGGMARRLVVVGDGVGAVLARR